MRKKKIGIIKLGESKHQTFEEKEIIFDFQCSELLGVTIDAITETVNNNLEKFPVGYLINFSLK
jgi:hypothetical protein